MSKNLQRGPFSSIVRAISLLLQGRIHFPKDRLGEVVDDGETSTVADTLNGATEAGQSFITVDDKFRK